METAAAPTSRDRGCTYPTHPLYGASPTSLLHAVEDVACGGVLIDQVDPRVEVRAECQQLLLGSCSVPTVGHGRRRPFSLNGLSMMLSFSSPPARSLAISR